MAPSCHAVFTDRAAHDPSLLAPNPAARHAPPQPAGEHPSPAHRLGGYPHPDPHEHTKAFTLAMTAIPVIAILGAVLWSFVYSHLQTRANERTIEAIRTGIVTGMSRDAAYGWLRDHGLVAVNPAYAAWTKNSLGVWYRSDDGAWPQPNEPRPMQPMARPLNPAHPEVIIRLTSAPSGGCGMATIEQILFDRFDRVKHIAYSAPYWTCQ